MKLNSDKLILNPDEVSEALQMYLRSKNIDFDPEVFFWNLPEVSVKKNEFQDCEINCILKF